MSTTGTALLGAALLLGLCPISQAQSVTIDFDQLAEGVTIADQYAEATFSSEPGFKNVTSNNLNLGTSLPNYLCTAESNGNLTCDNNTFVDFTEPVNNLTFLTTGDNASGQTALVDVFENGVFSAAVPIVTDGSSLQPDLVDLTGFSNVTGIRIHSITDPFGLAFDDFEFTGCGSSNLCNFCLAAPNSTGSAAKMSAAGSTSIQASDLVLTASPVPDELGLFIFAADAAEVPFGNGYLCLQGPVFRVLPAVAASNNSLVTSIDYSAAQGTQHLTAGSLWRFQAWFRDPAGGGATFNLSDGLVTVFTP